MGRFWAFGLSVCQSEFFGRTVRTIGAFFLASCADVFLAQGYSWPFSRGCDGFRRMHGLVGVKRCDVGVVRRRGPCCLGGCPVAAGDMAVEPADDAEDATSATLPSFMPADPERRLG